MNLFLGNQFFLTVKCTIILFTTQIYSFWFLNKKAKQHILVFNVTASIQLIMNDGAYKEQYCNIYTKTFFEGSSCHFCGGTLLLRTHSSIFCITLTTNSNFCNKRRGLYSRVAQLHVLNAKKNNLDVSNDNVYAKTFHCHRKKEKQARNALSSYNSNTTITNT